MNRERAPKPYCCGAHHGALSAVGQDDAPVWEEVKVGIVGNLPQMTFWIQEVPGVATPVRPLSVLGDRSSSRLCGGKDTVDLVL